MDDFDRLLALTDAAESCNGLARGFFDFYGSDPEFSRLHRAPGKPYCQPAANLQAKQRIDAAWNAAERMQGAIARWDHAGSVHWCVESAAVQIRQPTIEFNGRTHPTAHEAARYLAQAMIDALHAVEAYDEIEQSFELARKLADLRPIPDFYGAIRQEHHAACELVPVPEDESDNDNDKSDAAKRRSKWRMVHALLDNEPGADDWDLATRKAKARQWNEQYKTTAGWNPLSTTGLGQIIRDRRKVASKKDAD